MGLTLLKDGQNLDPLDRQFSELNNFCSSENLDLVFEWKAGQFWLHSDLPGEKPIGIEIDRELERHEDFFKRSSLQKELLAKAIGVKGPYRPKVFDLTAGLLGDSLLLLSFGCEVWASERHPVIKFLIQSALQNSQHPRISHFHFLGEEALSTWGPDQGIDVLFFDPMFEDANSKASPRKEMRIFRNLVGKDLDAKAVFHKALSLKPRRLVVKRPRHSVAIDGKPDVEYIGKSTRYDVYFSL